MGTNDVLGGFNDLLQSPPVLGCTQTTPVCNIPSQYSCLWAFFIRVEICDVQDRFNIAKEDVRWGEKHEQLGGLDNLDKMWFVYNLSDFV